jgi:hypothetical protein
MLSLSAATILPGSSVVIAGRSPASSAFPETTRQGAPYERAAQKGHAAGGNHLSRLNPQCHAQAEGRLDRSPTAKNSCLRSNFLASRERLGRPSVRFGMVQTLPLPGR